MPPAEAGLSYRPYLNRHRVVYVLHPQAGDAIAAAFGEQGFIASSPASLETLLQQVDAQRPDVILIELNQVQAESELIATLRALAFGVRIFLLADENPDAGEVVRSVRSGAVGVFVRPFQIADMINDVSEELRQDLRIGESANAPPKIQGLTSLTEREREVLRHVVAGQTNKEAAVELGISPRTIEVHRAAAMRKLGARNTAEMIRIALKS